MINEESHSKKSWFNKLTHALLGEPQDQEELLTLLRDASTRDILNEQSLAMIEGVLQVSEMSVRDIMIPRAQMAVIDLDLSLAEIIKQVIDNQHSRYPVIGESRDEVIGILLAKELLPYLQDDSKNTFMLREQVRPAVFVPESKRLDVLLQEFRRHRNHMAIVIDEYGGVAGLVTIEDVLEQIVGEIEDEFDVDDEESFIKKHDEQTFIIKALTPIEDFNDYFKATLADQDFDTIGGVIMHALGHVPARGEKVTLNERLQFEVLRADNRRVHLLQLELLSAQEDSHAA